MQIFDAIIFFKLRTIQQKTVKPTYLCPLGARKLAEGKGHSCSCHSYSAYLSMTYHYRYLVCFGSFFRTLAVNSVSDLSFHMYRDIHSITTGVSL